MKIKKAFPQQLKTVSPLKQKPNYGGFCSTCGRRDNDGGPLCGNVFCPGGN
ncbi:hypothetical protein RCIP0012_00187 [Klebsiella phage RCIP0012]|nr:hypothetical protein PWKp5_00181 [Klebsiella phage PWKp5]